MSRVIRQDRLTVLELGARYDSLQEGALEEFGGALLDEAAHAEPPRLVLDLTQTVVIGSSFLALLLHARKQLQQRNGTMVLCGLAPFCEEVLRIAHLEALWPRYATRAEAVLALRDG